MNFQKILQKHHSWLVGQCGKNLFRLALLHTSNVDTLQQLSCKISAKSAYSFNSYATFSFFYLVGWLGWLGWLDSSSEYQIFFHDSFLLYLISRKKSCLQLLGFQRYRHFCKLDKLSFFSFKNRKILTSAKKKITTTIVRRAYQFCSHFEDQQNVEFHCG